MSKQSYCAECGGHLNDQGEFHPFAFCALVRAGLDPWREVRTIALRLGLEVAEEDGKPLFQNARCGRVFKVGGGWRGVRHRGLRLPRSRRVDVDEPRVSPTGDLPVPADHGDR